MCSKPRSASVAMMSAGEPDMRSTLAPTGACLSEPELSTNTGLLPYGHESNSRTVSNVFRPTTNASTLAKNSSYPCGSPPSAGRNPMLPSARAMNPSRLVPTKTDAFTRSLQAELRCDECDQRCHGDELRRRLDPLHFA